VLFKDERPGPFRFVSPAVLPSRVTLAALRVAFMSRFRPHRTIAVVTTLCLAASGCAAQRNGQKLADRGETAQAAAPVDPLPNDAQGKSSVAGRWNGLFQNPIRLAGFFREQSSSDQRSRAEIDTGKQEYDQAEDLFKQKQYKDAEAAFRKLSRKYKDTPIEEDALFMMAECQFLTHRYPKAQDSYERLLKKYENSRHLDAVVRRQFSIARNWLSDVFPSGEIPPHNAFADLVDPTTPILDRHGRALEALTSVRLHDPTGPLADDALMMTASYYFLRGRYEDADFYFQTLRQDYPQSDHQPLAHVLGIRAKIRAYQGPEYDGQQLEEAERLARSTLRQFPDLKDERANLLRTLEAVRLQKAERIWNTADYYRRSGHPESASVYYQQLLDQYPDTRWAVLARERLGRTESDDQLQAPADVKLKLIQPQPEATSSS
jgi:outer membrane protein assembly factor BamD (BamD/ComL family)